MKIYDKLGFLKRGVPILLIIICFIFIILLLLSTLSLLTEQNYFLKENLSSTDDLMNIITIAATLTALVSIFFSIEQARKDRKNELHQTTINLFKDLRSETFSSVTDKAWKVRKKWKSWGKRDRYKCVISVYNEEPNENLELKLEHIQSIYDLIGFYTVLSLYRGNEDFIRQLNYFYYGWWRDFLYEFSEVFDKKRTNGLYKIDEFKNSKFRQEYIKNISLGSTLNRLDLLCGFENVPKKLQIHRKGS